MTDVDKNVSDVADLDALDASDVDETPDATGEVLRRIVPRSERILQRRDPWYDDPWDDPDMTDALVVERPRRSSRRAKLLVFIVGAHRHRRDPRRRWRRPVVPRQGQPAR